MSAAALPLVSIGLPVYNSARHLPKALDTFLAQTFGDFELVISDNASTDGTEAICREYADRDARVRYHRQASNIGAPRNWNAAFHAARGEFFKWSSGNDYCAPEFLARCVEAMQARGDVVLCYGRTGLIDEDGRLLEVYEGDLDLPEASPSDRFARVRQGMDMNNAQQGLMRSDVLRRTRLDRLYPGGDIALMAELALYGRFLRLPEVLLFRRQGPGAVMASKSPAEVQRIYNPQARRPMKLLRGRFYWDHFVSVARAPIPLREKARAWTLAARFARYERDEIWRELRSLLPVGGNGAGRSA